MPAKICLKIMAKAAQKGLIYRTHKPKGPKKYVESQPASKARTVGRGTKTIDRVKCAGSKMGRSRKNRKRPGVGADLAYEANQFFGAPTRASHVGKAATVVGILKRGVHSNGQLKKRPAEEPRRNRKKIQNKTG